MLFDDENGQDDNEDGFKPAVPPAAGGSLLPPREMADYFGHEAIEKELLAWWEAGRLPHALIFSGPEGIGKATMAFRLARFLLKHGRSGGADDGPGLFGEALPSTMPETMAVPTDDPVFRQVASGGHPDLLTVERPVDEKGQVKSVLPVEEVRKVSPFLQKTASQGGWRVVIVDDADTMNRNSQNAILKILEEPPADTVIILIAHRAGAFVPTIRSRCRMVSFQPPAPDVFETLLRRAAPELQRRDIDTLYAISGGSAGQGIRILEEGGLEAVGTIVNLLGGWPQWDWPAIHNLSDSLSRKSEGLQAFQDILLWVVESFVRAQARGEKLPAALDNDRLAALCRSCPLTAWVETGDNLRSHFETVERSNLDKRQAVLGAFMVLDGRKAAA